MSKSLVARAALFVLPCLAVVVGCGQSKGDVSGVVSYKGEKIPLGRITFLSEVGRKESFSGQITQGKYEVKGVTAGPTKVTIETYGTSGPTGVKAPPKMLQIPPKDFEAMQGARKLPIPAHYSNPEKSGLTYEVTSGEQKKDFDLK